MSKRIDDGVDLARSEVACLADWVQGAVDARGSRTAAAELLCIGTDLIGRIVRRPSALTVSRRALVKISEAMGVPLRELTKGAAT